MHLEAVLSGITPVSPSLSTPLVCWGQATWSSGQRAVRHNVTRIQEQGPGAGVRGPFLLPALGRGMLTYASLPHTPLFWGPGAGKGCEVQGLGRGAPGRFWMGTSQAELRGLGSPFREAPGCWQSRDPATWPPQVTQGL